MIDLGLKEAGGLAKSATKLVIAATGRREILIGFLMQIIGAVSIAIFILLGPVALNNLQKAVDRDIGTASLFAPAFFLGLLIGVQMALSVIQRQRQQLVGELISRHMQRTVMNVTTSVPLETFEEPDFHNRVERIRQGDRYPMEISLGLTGLLRGVVGAIAATLALLFVAPALTPLVILAIVPAWFGASRQGIRAYRFCWDMTPEDRQRHYLFDLLTGRRAALEIRAFGTAGYLMSGYLRLYDQRLAGLASILRKAAVTAIASAAASASILAATLVFITWMTVQSDMTTSQAVFGLAGVGFFGSRLSTATHAFGMLSEARLFLGDYLAFTKDVRTHSSLSGVEKHQIKEIHLISVEGITFAYPNSETPAVSNVSLSIGAGQLIAIVGDNGSGKTTLAKLIANLYVPQRGEIYWNGLPTSQLEEHSLRSSITVLPQDSCQYRLTVRENIGLGQPDGIDDRLRMEGAVRSAGATSLLEELEDGYSTWLGPENEGGRDLSIGQWQRIALARAFFRPAQLIILDEPGSALDAEAERNLFKLLKEMLHDRTVVFISHRFWAVKDADFVYVMDNGSIIESGTHPALMAQNARYANMYRRQAELYLDQPLPLPERGDHRVGSIGDLSTG